MHLWHDFGNLLMMIANGDVSVVHLSGYMWEERMGVYVCLELEIKKIIVKVKH